MMTDQSARLWCAWCAAIIVRVSGAAFIASPDGRRQWACDAGCLAELVAATMAGGSMARQRGVKP